MNPSTPSYLAPQVLAGSLTVIVALIFGLHHALKRADWPAPARKRATFTGALVILTWFVVALSTARLGLYRAETSRIPTIQCGILLPIALGLALFWLTSSVRRVIDALPQQWIVALQLYRAEGAIFLILYAGGHLPGIFAWPAGVGDILVGLLAPIVALRYTSNSPQAAHRLRTWNLFGLADLAIAITTGFLSSPSRFQIFALDAPNQLITAYPLVLIPVFLVPLAILLHFASLQKLKMGGQV